MASASPLDNQSLPQSTFPLQQQQPEQAELPSSQDSFKLTPDQVLELQFARLRAQQLRQLSEDELAQWKGRDHDPNRERDVLTAGMFFHSLPSMKSPFRED
jgi:hypothetical protein